MTYTNKLWQSYLETTNTTAMQISMKRKIDSLIQKKHVYSWFSKFSHKQKKLGFNTHPVQPMISGPSKEKGSLSSGSDLIL